MIGFWEAKYIISHKIGIKKKWCYSPHFHKSIKGPLSSYLENNDFQIAMAVPGRGDDCEHF